MAKVEKLRFISFLGRVTDSVYSEELFQGALTYFVSVFQASIRLVVMFHFSFPFSPVTVSNDLINIHSKDNKSNSLKNPLNPIC